MSHLSEEWISEDVDWVEHDTEYDLLDIPSPGAEIFNPIGTPSLPTWVTELRGHQWTAAVEVVEAFKSGADIVWLDAPTGTGKTLIAELVRRMLDVPAWYICTTKSLQDQFARDFDYAKVLKGRSNYPTLDQPYPEYTASDCTKSGSDDGFCHWCPDVHDCPYEMAKAAALKSKIGIINTSYFMVEANNVGKTKGRKLVIADECDTLESELMGFVTYEVSAARLNRLKLHAPRKGVHKKTIIAWLVDELIPAIETELNLMPRESADVKVIRDRYSLTSLKEDSVRVALDLQQELDDAEGIEGFGGDEDTGSNWVRDNDAGPLVLKPVKVNHYGHANLWQHGHKWLCMSGSIISSDEMNTSLGVYEAGLKAVTVTVPMTFPVENRPIKVLPVARMSHKEKETAWPVMAKAVTRVMERHPNDRILVHTVSYALSQYLYDNLRNSGRVLTYKSSFERDSVLAKYRRSSGAVLLAASMDRGIDLKHDDCRVVVLAKIPFPNLGDRQVGARLRSGRDGQVWYDVQTIRTIIQMTGRGVRSADDYCTTYILDSTFLEKIYKNGKMLLPEWWKDAMTVGQVREFI